MKKLKQILAILTIVIIFALYATTFILALMDNSLSDKLFPIALYATVGLPCALYLLFWLYKLFHIDASDKTSSKNINSVTKDKK